MVVLALTQSLQTVYLFQALVSSSVKWVLGQHLPCYTQGCLPKRLLGRPD